MIKEEITNISLKIIFTLLYIAHTPPLALLGYTLEDVPA